MGGDFFQSPIQKVLPEAGLSPHLFPMAYKGKFRGFWGHIFVPYGAAPEVLLKPLHLWRRTFHAARRANVEMFQFVQNGDQVETRYWFSSWGKPVRER